MINRDTNKCFKYIWSSDLSLDSDYDHFLKAVQSGELTELHWNSKEPLTWNFHWQVMQFLVDSDFAKNVSVYYQTNLSQLEWKNRHLLYDYLFSFKESYFKACYAETYSREVNWNDWVNKFCFIQKELSKIKGAISLDISISLPGLFKLLDIFDFVHEFQINYTIDYIKETVHPNLMSPLALPRELLIVVVNDLMKTMLPIYAKDQTDFIKILASLKLASTYEELLPQWQEDLRREKEQLKYDIEHLKTLFHHYPQVINWWTSN